MPLLFIFFLAHKVATRSPAFIPATDIDLVSGVSEFDAQQKREEEEEALEKAKMSKAEKFWNWIM